MVNPVLRKGEHEFSGYRSSARSRKLPIYFLHGSFDWGRFTECGHLVTLPPFAVGSNLWQVTDDWGGVVYHDHSSSETPHATGPAEHYLDWNCGRDLFQKEIKSALTKIRMAAKEKDMLLLLGFRGIRCPGLPTWHEEISDPIANAAEGTPTFMVITQSQKEDSEKDKPSGPKSEELSWLFNQVSGKTYGKVYVEESIDDWILKSLEKSTLNPTSIEREYHARWVSSPHLFLTVGQFERG